MNYINIYNGLYMIVSLILCVSVILFLFGYNDLLINYENYDND